MFSISITGIALSVALAGTAAPSTLPEAWVVDTGSPIHAPVTVDEDLVFVGNRDGRLVAVRIDTGEVEWSFQGEGALDGQATVDGEEVFVQSRGGRLYALARDDGRELWSTPTGETGPHDFWDFTLAAPVVHGASVVLGTGSGHLNVYSRDSGVLDWQFQAGMAIRGTPVLVGDTAYFGSFDGNVTALDLSTRETVWQFKALGSAFFPEGGFQGAPTIDGDLVHIGSRDYNLYVLDRASGRVMWNLRAPSWVIGGPAMDDEQLYFGTSDSRRIYAVTRRNGDTAWTFTTSSRVFGSPVIHEGTVYFGSFDGRIHGLDAASGEQRQVYRTRGGAQNHALVYDEEGGFAESFRALGRAGRQMEAEELILRLGSVGATPALSGDRLMFGSTDGHLYSLILPQGAATAGDR